MKKIKFLFVFLGLLILFAACNTDTNQEVAINELTIKMVQPVNVVTGQKIYITGSNFQDVTEIVFPGNISVTNFELVGFNQIAVVVPQGTASGLITLKSGGKEYKSPNEIKTVTPSFSLIYPTSVKTGEEVVIKGENLLEIKKIIFPDNIVVDDLHFNRKSETEIKIAVPKGTINGTGILKLTTLSGSEISSTPITIEVVENAGGQSKVDPITPNTIILLDYETHGGHNGSWDNGWNGSTEVVKDAETGNSYLRTTGTISNGWIMNCNHQANITATWPWVINSAENYIVKVDVLIPSDVNGLAATGMQFVLGDKWEYSYGDNLFPKTTDGEWVTIRVPFTKWNKTGPLDFKNGTNGLFGTIPKGIGLDNLRIDPAQ